jgi:hypothetical protein
MHSNNFLAQILNSFSYIDEALERETMIETIDYQYIKLKSDYSK